MNLKNVLILQQIINDFYVVFGIYVEKFEKMICFDHRHQDYLLEAF